MANEIQITPVIVYSNGTLKRQYTPGTINLPQATKGVVDNTITATSTGADFSVSALGTPGLIYLHSLESTTTGKTLRWGVKSSTGGLPKYFLLKPKQMAMATYASSAEVLRYQGNQAGSFQVNIVVFEA